MNPQSPITPTTSTVRVLDDHWFRTRTLGLSCTGKQFFAILVIAMSFFIVSINGDTSNEPMNLGARKPSIGEPEPIIQLVYSKPTALEYDVILPLTTDQEREQIEPRSAQGPQKIGIHRNIPSYYANNLNNRLTWTKYGDGVVAYLRVKSPNAHSIRLFADIKLPANSVITFYEVLENGETRVIDTITASTKGFDVKNYWTPDAIGENIGIEIQLQKPTLIQEVELTLLKIAHRFEVSQLPGVVELDCSGHEEIQCAIDNDEITKNVADSILKLVYEDSVFTYRCSATLLNVEGDGEDVYVPYVITANHCISTDDAASTVVAHWKYQTSSCSDTTTSTEFSRTIGGAELLATQQSYDQTLLRLNRDPPEGVWFSGWWATDVEIGTTAFGPHHPGGEHKKYYSGETSGNFNVSVCDDEDDCFVLLDSIQLSMIDGAAEGGSSGTGLFVEREDIDSEDGIFVGVLSGSDEKCTNGATYFGEFRHFYSSITEWFSPDPALAGDDHGDEKENATLVSLTSVTEGEIDDEDDIDYFRIEIDRPGAITVYTTGSIDTTGQLSNESDTLVVTDDDSGNQFNFSMTVEVGAGVYYVQVEGFGSVTGAYSLHIEFEEKDDHGDTQTAATTIDSSARTWSYSTAGNIDDAFDIDVFELILTHTSSISLSTEGDTDTVGLLINVIGEIVAENDNADNQNANFLLSETVGKGIYYLFVEGVSVEEKSAYTLDVEVDVE